jgi:hypothetical protein
MFKGYVRDKFGIWDRSNCTITYNFDFPTLFESINIYKKIQYHATMDK